MSDFLTKLDVELMDDVVNEYRGKWRLLASLIYHSDTTRSAIIVPAGFITDFESCPRLPLIFDAFGEVVHGISVVHDFLYSQPTTVSRKVADAVLLEGCLLAGVPRWRAYGIWLGVRFGGAPRFGKPSL